MLFEKSSPNKDVSNLDAFGDVFRVRLPRADGAQNPILGANGA